MPTDDELRRVAEDVRALVRSLVRDVRAGVDDVRKEANRSGRAMGEEFRKAARESRANLRAGRHHPHSCGQWYGWGRPTDTAVSAPRSDARPGPPVPRRPARPARAPRPPLRHRHDSSTVLGLVALVLGLSWLAATTHLFVVPWRAAVAVALMLLGAAMVVTARTDWALSRRAWPTILGATLIFVLVVGSASVAWPTFGDQQLSWTSWDAVPSRVDTGAGHSIVNLTGLPDLTTARSLEIHQGAGSLEVRVPSSLHVYLDASMLAGSFNYVGIQSGGVNQHISKDLGPPGGQVLRLIVRAAFGSVRIERLSS